MRHVLGHRIAGLEEVLVDACVRCPVFDPQAEESRAPWLVDMTRTADLADRAVSEISKAGQSTFWDRDHRCSVLMHLARQSVSGARDLLYSLLGRLSDSDDVVGVEQIVELDGADGLVFVARRLGQHLSEDADFWVDDTPVAALDEQTGTGTGLRALEAVATSDADVAQYLEALQRPRGEERGHLKAPPRLGKGGAQAHEARMKAITPLDVIALVRRDPKDRCFWLAGWGLHADSASLETVFAAMLEETSPSRISRFLRVFIRRGVPRFDDAILNWVDMDGGGGAAAVKVLAHLDEPRVRALALSRLTPPGSDPSALPLLVSNFRPGDHRVVEDVLRPVDDESTRHTILYDALNVFEANPVPEATAALCFVYEHTPCTHCRARAARLLAGLATIPTWILEEAAFDASKEMRKLALSGSASSGRPTRGPS